MKYVSSKNFIYLADTPYKLKDEIKTKLSGVYNNSMKLKGWRFPKTLHAYRELYKFFPELKDNTEFVADGKQAAIHIDYWLDKKERFTFNDESLREYQNKDACYLETRGNLAGGCLVLNEPRTGKTPTIIKTLKALGKRMNLVVCPSSLVFNWAKEFEKWNPECEVHVVNGTPKKRLAIYEKFGTSSVERVLIISKDTLKTDEMVTSAHWDVAIVDEAHFLRNYKSAQSQAIFKLKANVKYVLTGTPAVKHAVDVYGLLHFINPDAFPSYWQFADRYFNIDDGMWGKSIEGPKKYREEELKTIMALNSVQRKRKDVMKWLPTAQHQTIPVVMEKKQVKLYDQMYETFMATSGEVEIDTMNQLTQLMRLRQLCIDPRLLGFDVVGAKTTALLEFAEDNQEPFIVMTTFSSYFKIIKPELEKLGKKVGIIDGSVSKERKMSIAERFQRGEIDILLCNIIAAGTGFTLDRADTILFLDKDFNPANNEQAQDRIVPTTKERYHSINIISLVCAGSVDERVNDILDSKQDLTKIINRPGVFI